jgi:hypothetical protein
MLLIALFFVLPQKLNPFATRKLRRFCRDRMGARAGKVMGMAGPDPRRAGSLC